MWQLVDVKTEPGLVGQITIPNLYSVPPAPPSAALMCLGMLQDDADGFQPLEAWGFGDEMSEKCRSRRAVLSAARGLPQVDPPNERAS